MEMSASDTEVISASSSLLDGDGIPSQKSDGDEKTSGLGLSGMLGSMAGYSKTAKDFRAAMERRYGALGSVEELRALLIDILCLLHMEFYVRPRGD